MGRIGGVGKLEEFDEFAAAMAVSDQGMDLAAEEVDAGQQTHRTVALVFIVAREGGMLAGDGGQVGGGRCDRLDAGLLVVGDDRHRVAGLAFRCGGRGLDALHLPIDVQHVGHLGGKIRIAAFHIVAHFVRLHLVPAEDLAHRALRQIGKAGVALPRSVLARMMRQKPRCPQLVGIAKLLGLPACQRCQPSLGLKRNGRWPPGPRTVVQRRYRAFGHGALDTALHRLMMQSQRPGHRKKRRLFPIGQQYPRPLDPARRLGSRLRDRLQPHPILNIKPQFIRLPPRRHDLPRAP